MSVFVKFDLNPSITFDLIKGMTIPEFKELILEQQELAAARGSYPAQAASAIGWVIRKHLSKQRSLLEGLVCKRVLDGGDRRQLFDQFIKATEDSFDKWSKHAFILSAGKREPVEFHPFVERVDVTKSEQYEGGVDDMPVQFGDDFASWEEEQEAEEAYYQQCEWERHMAQSEMVTRKENVADAMNSERTYVYHHITSDEKLMQLWELDEEGLKSRARRYGWHLAELKAKEYVSHTGLMELLGIQQQGEVNGAAARSLAKRIKRYRLDTMSFLKGLEERIEEYEEQLAKDLGNPYTESTARINDARSETDADHGILRIRQLAAEAELRLADIEEFGGLEPIFAEWIEPIPYTAVITHWALNERELGLLAQYDPDVLELGVGKDEEAEYAPRFVPTKDFGGKKAPKMWLLTFDGDRQEDAAVVVNAMKYVRKGRLATEEATAQLLKDDIRGWTPETGDVEGMDELMAQLSA